MEKCINGAKKLIEEQIFGGGMSYGASFSSYGKTYFWSNENIIGYLNLIDLKDKESALTVLAGGDHTFNLISMGVLNVDTFDSNRLTEFYALELKRAIVLKYDYKQYLSFMQILCSSNISVDFLTDMIKGLLPYMSERGKTFWNEILDYNYNIQKKHGTYINLIRLLCVETAFQKDSSGYSSNKENYDALRKNLGKANITFKQANATTLDKEFNKQYDLILLSNILDYFDGYFGPSWTYDNLKEYSRKLETIAKHDAILFLHYIFYFDSYCKLIHDSDIYKRDLKDEEILEIPDSCAAILLKRVK